MNLFTDAAVLIKDEESIDLHGLPTVIAKDVAEAAGDRVVARIPGFVNFPRRCEHGGGRSERIIEIYRAVSDNTVGQTPYAPKSQV